MGKRGMEKALGKTYEERKANPRGFRHRSPSKGGGTIRKGNMAQVFGSMLALGQLLDKRGEEPSE